VGSLGRERDGEAAAYVEGTRTGRALSEPSRGAARAGDPEAGDVGDAGEDHNMAEETGVSVTAAGDRGGETATTSRPRSRGRAPQATSGLGQEATRGQVQ